MIKGIHRFTALELRLQRMEEKSKASKQKSISNELPKFLNWEEILASAGADIMAEEFKERERCAAVSMYPNWSRIPTLSSSLNLKGSVHVGIIILLMIGCTSAAVFDAILGNLGSDLAPLISLFGEKPTIQYLGQSLTLIDNIIFSLAPLGIITAIVSVIRVGRSPRLRSLIGRAQESRGAVESELMSSTSPDVCEMWNGQSVIRVIGSPTLLQLVCIRSKDGLESKVFTLAEAVREGIYKSQSNAGYHVQALKNPPNLSPNVSNKLISKPALVAFGVLGTALQASVLVFAALIQYKYITVVGKPNSIPEYAVYLLLGGTLLLTVGMFMCARIIEKSTVEVCWKPDSDLQVVWLQYGGQNVAGQLSESFAQCKEKPTLITSTKASNEAGLTPVILAVIFSLIGFVAQFIGFRSTHPYVILAQLFVTLVMTVIRSLAHMGKKGVNEIEKLDNQGDGHELDWLARKLEGCASWEVVVGENNPNHPTEVLKAESAKINPNHPTEVLKAESAKIKPNLATKVMKTRSRLAELSKKWPLKNRERARCLKKAIEGTMNEVYANMGLVEASKESTTFAWTLNVKTNQKLDTSDITLTLTRSADESGSWTAWQANEYDLEAVLFLWVSVFKGNRIPDKKPPKRIRLLGLPSEQAKIDYELWIKRGTKLNDSLESSPLESSPLESSPPEPSPPEPIYFGWAGGQSDGNFTQNSVLYVNAEEDVETLCAQEIYTMFMFRLGGIIENVRGETTPRTNNPAIESSLGPSIQSSSGRLCLINSNLASLAVVYSSSGLGSTESAYLCIVPALRASDKLPIEGNLLFGIRKVLAAWEDISSALSSDEGRALFNDVSKSGPYRIVQWFLNNGINVNALPGGSPARTGLQSAAEGGDDEIVRLLLSHGAHLDAEAASESGRTAMQAAAEKGHESIVRILITAGADVNEKPGEFGGCTALHAAANGGHSKIVELLLEKGAEINQELEGRTELQAAACAGHLAVVEALCGKGAKGDEVVNGQAALHLAAQAGHGAIVTLFLDKGVDVNLTTEKDRTALHRAAEAGRIEVIKLLLERGASIDAAVGDHTAVFLAAEAGHAEAVKLLIVKGAKVHDPSGKIMSLHRAAKEQKEDVVKLLLLGGASAKLDAVMDANAKLHPKLDAVVDADAELDAELDAVTETSMIHVVRTLLSAGAIVDALGDDPGDPSGKLKRTALQAAAKAGYEKIVQILCEKGADVGAVVGDRTALHLAAQGGHFGVVKILLDKNADIDGIAKDRTAVFLAAEAGYAEVVKLLVEKGANVHDSSGKIMSLHRAAEGRQENVVKLLLKGGAEARLHVAAEDGKLTVVQFLLDAGADVNTLGGDPQRTALQAAANAGHEEVVRLLLEKKAAVNFGQHQINRMKNFRNVFSPKKEVDNAYPTALYVAAKANHERIVRLLLENEADVNSQPSALEVAARNGFDSIIQLLLARPIDDDTRRAARSIAKKAGRPSTIQLFSKTPAASASPVPPGTAGSEVLQQPSGEGGGSKTHSRPDLQSMSKDGLKEEVVGGSGSAAVDSGPQRNLGSPPQSRNGTEKQTVAEGDPNNPGSRPASKGEQRPGESDSGEILRLSALETENKNILLPKANDESKELRLEKGIDDKGASLKMEDNTNPSRAPEAGSGKSQTAGDDAEEDHLSPTQVGARPNSQALGDRLDIPQSIGGNDRNDGLLPSKSEVEHNFLPKVPEEGPTEPQPVVGNDHEGTSPPSLDAKDINPSPQIIVPNLPSQVEIRSKGKQPARGESEKVDLLSSGAKNESKDLQLPEAGRTGPQKAMKDGGRASSPVSAALSPTLVQDDPPAKPRSPTSQSSSVRVVNSPPPRVGLGQSDSSLSGGTSAGRSKWNKIHSTLKGAFQPHVLEAKEAE